MKWINAHHGAHSVSLQLKIMVTNCVLSVKVCNYIKFLLIKYYITILQY